MIDSDENGSAFLVCYDRRRSVSQGSGGRSVYVTTSKFSNLSPFTSVILLFSVLILSFPSSLLLSYLLFSFSSPSSSLSFPLSSSLFLLLLLFPLLSSHVLLSSPLFSSPALSSPFLSSLSSLYHFWLIPHLYSPSSPLISFASILPPLAHFISYLISTSFFPPLLPSSPSLISILSTPPPFIPTFLYSHACSVCCFPVPRAPGAPVGGETVYYEFCTVGAPTRCIPTGGGPLGHLWNREEKKEAKGKETV